MTKQTIEVDGLPEGWEVTNVEIDRELIRDNDKRIMQMSATVCLQKTIPRRIVLEETEELMDIEYSTQNIVLTNDMNNITHIAIKARKVWREVNETDNQLTNAEPKLSLSVDECKEAMRKLETFNVSDLSVKICRFLKENS